MRQHQTESHQNLRANRCHPHADAIRIEDKARDRYMRWFASKGGTHYRKPLCTWEQLPVAEQAARMVQVARQESLLREAERFGYREG